VVAVPGPWIAVRGAALTDVGWVVQLLPDLVHLQFDPYDPDRMLNVARHFLALRESLKELDTFYKEIEHQKVSVLWPLIRAYEGVQFEYLERLLPECLSMAMLKARMLPNNEMIVVKFTNSYGADAHRLLNASNWHIGFGISQVTMRDSRNPVVSKWLSWTSYPNAPMHP
jgi:hypothetical protein